MALGAERAEEAVGRAIDGVAGRFVAVAGVFARNTLPRNLSKPPRAGREGGVEGRDGGRGGCAPCGRRAELDAGSIIINVKVVEWLSG